MAELQFYMMQEWFNSDSIPGVVHETGNRINHGAHVTTLQA